jgi:hypothetical protein
MICIEVKLVRLRHPLNLFVVYAYGAAFGVVAFDVLYRIFRRLLIVIEQHLIDVSQQR